MIRTPRLDGAVSRAGGPFPAALLAAAALANLILAALLAGGRAPLVVGLLALIVVAVVAATRERWVLYAVLGFNMVSSVVFYIVEAPAMSVGGFEVFPQDIALALLVASWLAWEASRAPRGSLGEALSALRREPILWPLAAFLFFVAIAMARSGLDSLNTARPFLYAVIALVVYRIVTSARELRIITAVVVAGASVTSAVGLYLLAVGSSITDAELSTGGTRGVAISASYLVASALIYVIATRVTAAGRFARFWPLLILLLAGGLLASGARQTWLGVIGAVAVFALVSPARGLFRMAAALAAALAIAFGAYGLLPETGRIDQTINDFTTRASSDVTQDNSAQDRVIKWGIVWDQVKAQPLLGTGFGATFTYTTNFSITGSNFVRHTGDDPENTHLWIWARTGTLGFLSWVALNLTAFASLMVRFFRAPSPLLASIALWGAGTLIVVWAGMAFSPVSSFRSTLLVFWLLFALAPILRALEERTPRAAPVP